MARPKNTDADFWPLVDVKGKNECWPFNGTRDRDGYGKFRVLPESLAHRIAYRSRVGPIPDGIQILHTCDNPSCCNPAHLFLGTPTSNMTDMWTKGRHPRPIGERNHHAKLTADDVREIRRRFKHGDLQREIAKDYGIRQTNVSAIVTGATWKHV